MARGVWSTTAQDQSGNIVVGASVTVVDESTGIAPAAGIHDARTGGSSLTNPFVTDSNGFAEFYVEPGRYRITITGLPGTIVHNNQEINTMQVNDADTTGGSVLTFEDAGKAISANKQSYTATYSSNVYTVTPEINPTVWPTLQAGLIIEFDLSTTANTSTVDIDFNGTVDELKWINGDSLASGDLDGDYTARIRCRFNGTDWLIISDVSGSNANGNWERKADGLVLHNGQVTDSVTSATLISKSITLPTTLTSTTNAAATATLQGTVGGGEFLNYFVSVDSTSQITAEYLEFGGVSRTGSYTIRFSVSGRWYQ